MKIKWRKWTKAPRDGTEFVVGTYVRLNGNTWELWFDNKWQPVSLAHEPSGWIDPEDL